MKENGYLEVAGKAVALAAALLPAVGFLVRYVAFALDETVHSPVQLAIAAPLVLLAFTGAVSLLNFIPYVSLFGVVSWIAPSLQRLTTLRNQEQRLRQRLDDLRSKVDDPAQRESVVSRLAEVQTESEEMERTLSEVENVQPWKSFLRFEERIGPTMVRWFWRLSHLTFAIGVVAGLLFMRSWPLPFLSLITSLLCIFVLQRAAERHGRLTLPQVWPVMLILLSASGVVSGLSGHVPGVTRGEYNFSTERARVNLKNGSYLQLGETGKVMYLKACDSIPSGILSVRWELVDSVSVLPQQSVDAGPSLWAILFKGQKLRLGHRGCERRDETTVRKRKANSEQRFQAEGLGDGPHASKYSTMGGAGCRRPFAG